MSYLTIANQCDFTSDPNVFMEVTVRSDASTADVADRMREHGQIHLAISDLLQGGSWPDDELEPVFLRDDVI